MRCYFGKQVELLAPAGTYQILESLIDAGADAFYLGGKRLNMRLHRSEYNFSEAELIKARELTRRTGKNLYITVNNLLSEKELSEARQWLEFLAEKVQPDAVIVQDISLLNIAREFGLQIHASVMMNAHNIPGIRELQACGVTRVVLSREASFEQARKIHEATGIEIEYFAHGDLCSAHGSQCYYSGMLFGMSSNRGLCMKPCRWPYSTSYVVDGKEQSSTRFFPLAVRDMFLYPHLQDAIEAGIMSFKIEGRMRTAEYLKTIISAYAKFLDALCGSKAFDPLQEYEQLYQNRMRDFTCAYAFGKPGSAILNERWEGTGKFYSTGKVFSVAKEEPEAGEVQIQRVRSRIESRNTGDRQARTGTGERPELSVRVHSRDQAEKALQNGADILIVPLDSLLPGFQPHAHDLIELKRAFPEARLALSLPRMMNDDEFEEIRQVLSRLNTRYDELYISHLGQERYFREAAPALCADFSTNIYNSRALKFWKSRGISTAGLSLELKALELLDLLEAVSAEQAANADNTAHPELLAYGRPTVMYMELDPFQAVREKSGLGRGQPMSVTKLVDEKGYQHPVVGDTRGRFHVLPVKPVNLYRLIPELAKAGVRRFRIEGATMEPEQLGIVVRAFADLFQTGIIEPDRIPRDQAGEWLGALGMLGPEGKEEQ